MEERVAHALEGLAVAPGLAELQRILADVHVDAPHAEHVGGARARNRGLEAWVTRDYLVGQDAAVAVAADAEAVGVRDALLDDVVDSGEHVRGVDVAPVGVDRLRELEAAA